jgi:ubiquinone/menaquinone biosynthesis C-methylase UbiE
MADEMQAPGVPPTGPEIGGIAGSTMVSDVLNPPALLQRAGVSVGMKVADLGAGREGSFTIAAAKMVSAAGQVYSLDVVKGVLEVIKGLAEQAGVNNVMTIWTDLEMYGAAKAVPDGSIDIGILANTIYQSEQKQMMLEECLRMIKPGGKLLVVEWKPVETVLGPPVEQRLQPMQMKELAEKNHLTLVDEFDAGEYHWAQIYQK